MRRPPPPRGDGAIWAPEPRPSSGLRASCPKKAARSSDAALGGATAATHSGDFSQSGRLDTESLTANAHFRSAASGECFGANGERQEERAGMTCGRQRSLLHTRLSGLSQIALQRHPSVT